MPPAVTVGILVADNLFTLLAGGDDLKTASLTPYLTAVDRAIRLDAKRSAYLSGLPQWPLDPHQRPRVRQHVRRGCEDRHERHSKQRPHCAPAKSGCATHSLGSA